MLVSDAESMGTVFPFRSDRFRPDAWACPEHVTSNCEPFGRVLLLVPKPIFQKSRPPAPLRPAASRVHPAAARMLLDHSLKLDGDLRGSRNTVGPPTVFVIVVPTCRKYFRTTRASQDDYTRPRRSDAKRVFFERDPTIRSYVVTRS